MSMENAKKLNATELTTKNMYEYGISVIEDRAIPDYRDGLKPVQRRLMRTADDLHAYSNGKTIKSARITGDCMGRYSPHADSYGALVTLVNSEYSPIYGQGNWGDLRNEAASSRYTEAKISDIGMKMLECMEVSDFVPNYTGEFKEPVIIPTRFPYFFVNSCSGIAVGISCNIPAHNLEEVVNAFKALVKKGKDATIKDIAKYIKGPDYRYGGKMLSTPAEVKALYENGEGTLKYECEYEIQKDRRNWLLTVTGYCPGFSPDAFIKKMMELIDEDIVLYVNDSATKDQSCKLEVMFKNEEDFEKHIHKHLVKTQSYRYYAVERTKSKSEEKDIDTRIISTNLLELMQKWLAWRRIVETEMCQAEKAVYEAKCWHAYLRLLASKHVNIVMEALKSKSPIDYIAENMPHIKGTKRATEAAKYICDLKIISIQQIDQDKMNKDIEDYRKRMAELDADINDIDRVILRELEKLKVFYRPRMLKIG